MSSLNPSSAITTRASNFLSNIKPAASHLLGASALFLMSSLPTAIATRSRHYQEAYGNEVWTSESSHYSIGSSVLPCAVIIGVIGVIIVANSFFSVPREENIIDKVVIENCPELLQFEIPVIRKAIEDKRFEEAIRLLEDMSRPLKKREKSFEDKSEKNKKNLEAVEQVYKSIDNITEFLENNEKTKALKLLPKLNDSKLQEEIKIFIKNDQIDNAKKLLSNVSSLTEEKITNIKNTRRQDFLSKCIYTYNIRDINGIIKSLKKQKNKKALSSLSIMEKYNDELIEKKSQRIETKKKDTTRVIGVQTDYDKEEDVKRLEREIRGLKLENDSLENHFEEQQYSLVSAKVLAREAKGELMLPRSLKQQRSQYNPSQSSDIGKRRQLPSSSSPQSNNNSIQKAINNLTEDEKVVIKELLKQSPESKRKEINNYWLQFSEDILTQKLKKEAQKVIQQAKEQNNLS